MGGFQHNRTVNQKRANNPAVCNGIVRVYEVCVVFDSSNDYDCFSKIKWMSDRPMVYILGLAHDAQATCILWAQLGGVSVCEYLAK